MTTANTKQSERSAIAMNDDRQAGSKEIGGGGEWTALREALERAKHGHTCKTCGHRRGEHAMDLVGEHFCEHDGGFGPDCNCKSYVGIVPPSYAELLKLLEALAAAAPAPPTNLQVGHDESRGDLCEGNSSGLRTESPSTFAPPPQDGQGSELLGPPRGGSSSDLAGPSNLKVGDIVNFTGRVTCLNESPLWYGVEFKTGGHRYTHNIICYPSDVTLALVPSKAEREVASATNNPGAVIADEVLRRIAKRYENCSVNIYPDMPCLTPVEAVLRCAQEEGFRLTSIVPEAVAGNASAPVGENEHATLQRIREWKAQGKMLTDAELLLLKLAGQASVVGEPRGRCPECAVADQLQCVLDKGHEGDCMFAEWPYRAREVGEGLREAQLVDLRTLWMERAKRLRKDAAYIDCAVTLEACADELSSLFRLAAPAPKPAPPAEPDARFEAHTKAVADFLNELYAIMVDPLPDGPIKVAEMQRALLEAAKRDREYSHFINYYNVEATARLALERWRMKPHNAKWWKKIDGTPIPNDLIVCISEDIAVAVRCAAERKP